MLNSAFHILKHFVPADILRFNFEYFQIIRTDVEEVFYLVAIHGNWYLVFETDHIMSIHRTYDEALEIFGEDFNIEGWIIVDRPGSMIDPKTSKLDERELLKSVSLTNEENYLYYAVMKLSGKISSSSDDELPAMKELKEALEAGEASS